MSEKFVSYFRPGQILFLVDGTTNDRENVELENWANTFAPDGVKISAQKPLPFPPYEQQGPYEKGKQLAAVSLSQETVGKELPPLTHRRNPPPFPLSSEIPTNFRILPATVAGLKKEEPGKLLDLVLKLDDNRKTGPKNLRAVSPNWFVSGGSSSPGGTGGPSGQPVPYKNPSNATVTEYKFNFDKDVIPEETFRLATTGNQGAGVVVAILDTIPIQNIDDIYTYWVAKGHPLLKSLHDSGLLSIDKDTETQVDTVSSDFGDPEDYLQSNEDGHDYLMSDHGLFAAGIVHTLAPKARIHLIQVLNRYGMSDLTSIASGLQKVIQKDGTGNNVVVNMSLTINFPLESDHNTTNDPKGNELGKKILSRKDERSGWMKFLCLIVNIICWLIAYIFGIRLRGCEPTWYDRQAWAMLWICKSVSTLNSNIIAAAGNRRRGLARTRPHAEYPAAFPDVLGVGALPKYATPPSSKLDPASYSNFSDRPDGSGITTLGGEPGEKNGILGIYVGEFPIAAVGTRPSNDSGWAWWSGTSFATPIVTGVVAAMLSNMLPGGSPKQVIDKLLYPQNTTNARPTQRRQTKENEEVFFVTQC
jgi:subtilisin family serine protease